MPITSQLFGHTRRGAPVTAYRMHHPNGACAVVLDYGGTVQSLCVPDRSGRLVDVDEEEKILCEDAVTNVSDQVGRPYTVSPDRYLKDGEELTIADMTCKLIATPGHTVGSCCYYFKEADILIAGDTLFQDSVGRTDLATGSMSALVRSVRDKLFVLPEETKVYPGHGEATTIGHEKKYNPFLL